MKTKLFKTKLLPLGILSVFSVTPLLLGGMSANAQWTTPDTPAPPAEPAPGVTPIPDTSPDATAPDAAVTELETFRTYSPDNAPLLAMGSQGRTVRDAQILLREQGKYDGPIDGIYGPQTRAAVVEFQQANNLLVDGIIGPQTWNAMFDEAQQLG